MAGYNIYNHKKKSLEIFEKYCWKNHYDTIRQSEWLSLPELTNANGIYCPFSCRAQLWSVATIIEAMNFIKIFS